MLHSIDQPQETRVKLKRHKFGLLLESILERVKTD